MPTGHCARFWGRRRRLQLGRECMWVISRSPAFDHRPHKRTDLLAGAIMTPLYSKCTSAARPSVRRPLTHCIVADILGRKIVYFTVLLLFMIGSALCGAAQNIAWLCAARAVQGALARSLFSLFPADTRAHGWEVEELFNSLKSSSATSSLVRLSWRSEGGP